MGYQLGIHELVLRCFARASHDFISVGLPKTYFTASVEGGVTSTFWAGTVLL